MKDELQKERQQMLRKERQLFESIYPMTSSERKEVRKWSASGHSIYSNPWYYYDGTGDEMNYLDALRWDKELCEKMAAQTKLPSEI